MRVRRSDRKGVRAEALQRIDALEARCGILERDVCALGIAEKLRQALTRISDLEEQLHQRRAS